MRRDPTIMCQRRRLLDAHPFVDDTERKIMLRIADAGNARDAESACAWIAQCG
jgi:hypothetical protein